MAMTSPGAAVPSSQSQASPAAAARLAATIRVGRERRESNGATSAVVPAPPPSFGWSPSPYRGGIGLEDTSGAHVDHGDVGMARGPVELDRAGRAGVAAGIFGFLILEAFGHLDADAMLVIGDRIADRLDAGVDQAFDADQAGPPGQVGLELDRPEPGLVHLVESGGKDAEDGRAGFGLLAG